jgi:hypothetical protein
MELIVLVALLVLLGILANILGADSREDFRSLGSN